MRVPPHRQEGPRRRRGAKEALPRVRPQLPGVDGAGARHTTKLPAATWARYAEAMLAGATLRDAAAACGVSLKTSFSMRHRLCEVMASMLPAFEAGPGCPVEADEALAPDSLSGNHSRSAGFPCPAPHAGAGATGPLPA